MKSEFQINTRTEWRVIYVNAFEINLSGKSPYSSPLPCQKKAISFQYPNIRESADNPFDKALEFDEDDERICLSEENLKVKKARVSRDQGKPVNVHPLKMQDSGLFLKLKPTEIQEESDRGESVPFDDVLSQRTDYVQQQ
jgi:hypothetical protein